MALSWNEIKERAVAFSKEWEDTTNEDAEAKPFLEAFFNIFGITRKRVGTFEHRVKKIDDSDGYIDLLWKGTILIEMKSNGKNLDKAFIQAKDYIHGVKEQDLPKYILVCDFQNFRLFDTETQETTTFKLKELVSNVEHFGFIAGYQKRIYKEQDPVNIKAAELMGKLHDRLQEIGYDGHPLEVYLVRLLFCLFAEDTTIFERQQFQNYIEERTNEDGSDLAAKIQELFQTLNTANESRFKNLDEQLNAFPYVNGKLFEEVLPSASFDSAMRTSLLECCYIDWSKISPAIFGSMFQSVMNPKERRNLGAHYTSEKNILKLIKPLFLDDLWKEFQSLKNTKGNQLSDFHKRLSQLKFLDPACGCGNFLIITYRELRLLEIEVLRTLNKSGQGFLDIREIIWLDVDMMYGIEYEEFPARIAEVAMWLMDHQMNMLISNEFGQYFARLPLKKAAKIVHGNALRMEWTDLLKRQTIEIETGNATVLLNEPLFEYQTVNIKTKNLTIIDQRINAIEDISSRGVFDYIIGNPPFIGSAYQTESQKSDMEFIFSGLKNFGMLDYVTAWYKKAAQIIMNTKTRVAFVSTNSITQGEQPGVLWTILYNLYKVKIHLAHRTFSWSNEAKGNAAVHVVIIGFANFEISKKVIYEYQHIKGEALEIAAKNINPYLVDAKDIIVTKLSKPICDVPIMSRGSDATDDGNLLLTQIERDELIAQYPACAKYIKPFLMGREFLNNIPRYCLWLKDADLAEIKKFDLIYKRIQNVKTFRESSKRPQTLKAAKFPYLFGEERQPNSDYLAIPKVSSERRDYIPIAFCSREIISGDKLFNVPNATLFHFGIITSKMHMTWAKSLCGRLKSDYSYSNTIVYNNYPWPENLKRNQLKQIEDKAQNILDVRASFPTNSLADLYDPVTMPQTLLRAHNELDKAVDLAYRSQQFTNEVNRMEFLFALYEKYTADLFSKDKKKKV